MIDYDAGRIFALAAELGAWQAFANNASQLLEQYGLARILFVLNGLREIARQHGMEALALEIEGRVADIVARGLTAPIGQHLQEVSQRFSNDLQIERVCHFSTDERRLLTDEWPFGRDAMEATPSIIDDAREASRSLATSRYTASVFHSMRVMETLTRRLAAALKIEVKAGETMGGVVSKIEAKLRSPASRMQRPTKVRVSAAVAILHACKDAWRNPVAHPGRMYREGEARDILNFAIQLTGQLATGRRSKKT